MFRATFDSSIQELAVDICVYMLNLYINNPYKNIEHKYIL